MALFAPDALSVRNHLRWNSLFNRASNLVTLPAFPFCVVKRIKESDPLRGSDHNHMLKFVFVHPNRTQRDYPSDSWASGLSLEVERTHPCKKANVGIAILPTSNILPARSAERTPVQENAMQITIYLDTRSYLTFTQSWWNATYGFTYDNEVEHLSRI